MLKNFICHQRGWLTVGIAAYIIVGSCEGNCAKKDTKRTKVGCPTSSTAPTTPSTDDTAPDHWNGATDSLDSAASDASVDSADSAISSGSSGSGSSSGSSGSGSSSGYGSSGGGTYVPPPPPPPPQPPAPFAGLDNVGNTCYMNAVLQVLAALYKNRIQNGPLKGLIDKINTTHQPLDRDYMNAFKKNLPGSINQHYELGTQHDAFEFIQSLNDEEKFLEPIIFTTRTVVKIKTKDSEVGMFQREINRRDQEYLLGINLKKSLPKDLDINDMIVSSNEELINDTYKLDIKAYTPLGNEKNRSAFLQKNARHLTVLEKENGTKINFIKQVIYKIMPSILCIHLRRFAYGEGFSTQDKLDHSFNNTLSITIHPDPNKEDTVLFDLNGCIVHSGDDNSGHYVAYVKREGKWYKANDEKITEIDESAAEQASQDAYLLFYIKR